MLISLPPAVEKQISSRARAEGLAPSDYVERLLLEDEECRSLLERLVDEAVQKPSGLFSRLRAKYTRLQNG